jgi:DNA invertase Pin-like site-specific DNA recombinase
MPGDQMRGDSLPTTHSELLDALPSWAWTARDRRKTIRLIAARDGLIAAEHELREAVRDAYDGGNSWRTIGTILGISRQAAQRRFPRPPDDSEPADEG